MTKIIDKIVKSKYPPKQTNVTWIDTSQKPAVTKSYIDGQWVVVGGGVTDYNDIKNKPTINGVELDGNKTSQELGVYSKPSGGIPQSDLSSDVQSQLNKHFKGWYDSDSNLPTNPVVGDYAYVKGAESTDPAAIYECTTNGSWSDSGRSADTSNVQTFASGEEVNEVHIVNDLTTGGVDDVLSAEQGVKIGNTLSTLGNIVTQILRPTRNGTKVNPDNAYAVFFSSINVSSKNKLWLHINKPLEDGYIYAFGYTIPNGNFRDSVANDILNGFYQHGNNDWVVFDVEGLTEFEIMAYKTTLPFEYPTTVSALRVSDFKLGEGVVYTFEEPLIDVLNDNIQDVEVLQDDLNQTLFGNLDLSNNNPVALSNMGRNAVINGFNLKKGFVYNVEIDVTFDVSRATTLYIGFAKNNNKEDSCEGTFTKTNIFVSETHVITQFTPSDNYSNCIFFVSNYGVDSENLQYITARLTSTSIVDSIDSIVDSIDSIVDSIPEQVASLIPKNIKNVSLIPTYGFIPNIDTINKVIDFGSDPVLIVGATVIAPYSAWRNIPFYVDGNPTGAIKMIVNAANRTVSCKALDYTLSKDEVVIGTFRLEYNTHKFISANFPFSYTVDGKISTSINWNIGSYSGELININSYKTRLAFTKNYFSGNISNWRPQGMDVYANRYIIQGNDAGSGNATICVLDIVNKTVVGEAEISTGAFHSNNVNIGNKYDDSDVFPLIYVSECYGMHSCKVIRLADDVSECTILQTITYSGTHYVNAEAQDWFIDIKNNYLYSLGIKTGGNTYQGPFEILRFNLPSTSSSTVELTDNDILDTFETSDFKVYQGQKIINGKLYLPFGFGSSSYPGGLAVFDFDKDAVVSKISDLSYEPEGIGVYDGNILINSSGGSYYLFEF